MEGAGLRWLFLDLNSYFASVEQQDNPPLRGRPVIVVPVMTDSTCAIAASYQAKAFGIKTGTPVHEAKRRCPDLRVVLARHEAYVRVHHRIVEEVERHLHVSKVCSIDEMACELLGTERQLPNALALASNIKRGIAERVGEYLTCSIGLAPNRFLAKVASDMQKPDGLVALEAHDLPGRLFDLSLRDLPGIGPNMERRLLTAGIPDIKTLWHISPSRARAAWGSIEGERFWYALHGHDLPDRETQRHTIGHSHVLAPELRPISQAYQVARRLTVKAASRLRRLEHRAGSLDLSVRIENGPRWAGSLRFAPTQDTIFLLGAVNHLWNIMSDQCGMVRIKKASVTLHGLVPEIDIVPDLFSATAPKPLDNGRGMRLSKALDSINQKYGRDAIGFGMVSSGVPQYTGTKIAFTRIPDQAEFQE